MMTRFEKKSENADISMHGHLCIDWERKKPQSNSFSSYLH